MNRLRLDYCFLSEALLPRVRACEARRLQFGSDHCPLAITLALKPEVVELGFFGRTHSRITYFHSVPGAVSDQSACLAQLRLVLQGLP